MGTDPKSKTADTKSGGGSRDSPFDLPSGIIDGSSIANLVNSYYYSLITVKAYACSLPVSVFALWWLKRSGIVSVRVAGFATFFVTLMNLLITIYVNRAHIDGKFSLK